MFHGVQARNQIFLGEFQLSDKVGCILAYPGSYPPTIPNRTPQVPPGNTPLGCIVVGAAIPLPLGRVNPSVAAWIICTRPIRIPILLRQNAHCKGGVTSTIKQHYDCKGGVTSTMKQHYDCKGGVTSTIKQHYDENIKLSPSICKNVLFALGQSTFPSSATSSSSRKRALQIREVTSTIKYLSDENIKRWNDDDADGMMTPDFWSVVSASGKAAVREAADQPRGRPSLQILRYTSSLFRYIWAFPWIQPSF